MLVFERHSFSFVGGRKQPKRRLFGQTGVILSRTLKSSYQTERDAPFLLEQRELIGQAHSERIIADSSKGFKLGISAQAHSLHEDRPTQGFYHRYRTMASLHLKKPLYHWVLLMQQAEFLNFPRKARKPDTRLSRGPIARKYAAIISNS